MQAKQINKKQPIKLQQIKDSVVRILDERSHSLLPLISERPQFWNLIALALLLSFFGGLLYAHSQNPESLKLITQGDFTARYTTARTILEGQIWQLYNPEVQRTAQEAIWPNQEGGFLYFRYPPFTALMLAPFGFWDPVTARILFTFIMSLFLVMSLRAAACFSPALRASTIQSVALTVAVLPIMIGVLSGQNNALTLLLYALIMYGFYRNDSKGYWIAGMASGLMLYKPQFGVLWVGWMLLTRKREIIRAMFFPVLIYYWMGVWVQGWDWPLQWIRETSWAVAAIQAVDRHCMISINGAASALSGLGFMPVSAQSPILILSYLLSAILALRAGWRFWTWGTSHRISMSPVAPSLLPKGEHPFRIVIPEERSDIRNPESQNPGCRVSAKLKVDPPMLCGGKPGMTTKTQNTDEGFLIACSAGPICLLASPHTMFYDFGLCVIACAPFFNSGSRKHLILILFSFAIIWASMAFRDTLPIQPLFGLTILCAMALTPVRGRSI